MYVRQFRGKGYKTFWYFFFSVSLLNLQKSFIQEAALFFRLADFTQITISSYMLSFWWCSAEAIRWPLQVYELCNCLFEKCSCLTHTFIFQFALDNFDKWRFHRSRQRGFLSPGRTLLENNSLPAQPDDARSCCCTSWISFWNHHRNPIWLR